MKRILNPIVFMFLILFVLPDCKKPEDEPQITPVSSTPDIEGNLAVFNKTNEALYFYHQGEIVKEIPAGFDNFIIQIPNDQGVSVELKLWKKSTVSDLNNPDQSMLFRKWETVLPAQASAESRVSWVIQEGNEKESGTFSFNYPEFGENNIHALYSVDVFLNGRTGSKITAVSPGTNGKIIGNKFGYHTVHYLYWYSDPNSSTGRVDIGWIDKDSTGNTINYVLNTGKPYRDISIPIYYGSSVGRSGKLNITNSLTQIVVIYANGNLIENVAIEPNSTNGLSYLEPADSYLFTIPENFYRLDAKDPVTNATLKTVDNLSVLSQYQSNWVVSNSTNYQTINITNNLQDRITFHECSGEQYLGFWIEPMTTIQRQINTDLHCILGINWTNTWTVYLDTVVPDWIIDNNDLLPAITTKEVTSITHTGAVSGGIVINEGLGPINAKGVCWSTLQNPGIENDHTSDGTGPEAFNSIITNLSPLTTYYVRAYITNSVGTVYGNQVPFTTSAGFLPSVTTSNINNVTTTTADGGGNVTSQGTTTVTEHGVCWSPLQSPTIENDNTVDGSGTGVFNSNLTGLTPATTYYVRAYATNAAGTAYGSQVQFITSAGSLPTVTTSNITNVTTTTATGGGNVTSQGIATVITRGVCWSPLQSPTIENDHTVDGSGSGVFNSILSGLTPATTYYVRAYATNTAGTAYGEELIFSTSFIDARDGNEYETLKLGYQLWMKENLAYLPSVSLPSIGSITTPFYYVNGYWGTNVNAAKATANYMTYGVLYNWPASLVACPDDWHLPSDAEWTALTNYVSGQPEYLCNNNTDWIAKALAATTLWNSSVSTCAVGNNLNNNNTTNFTGLPGGARDFNGNFEIGNSGYWWSSTDYSAYTRAWIHALYPNGATANRYHQDKSLGLQVRCLKN